jgi:drug/metabolite transporter (DMT)-like permease
VHETGSGNEQKPLRRSGVVILGGIFMLAGAAGLLLPIEPGAFLIFVGALLLGCRCTWLRRLREKCRARFPALERAAQWLSAKSGSWQSLYEQPGRF